MFRMNLITSEKLVRNLWARKELNLSQNPPQEGRQNNPFSGRLMAEEREIYTSSMRARRSQGQFYIAKDKKVPDSVTISVKTKTEKERGNELREKMTAIIGWQQVNKNMVKQQENIYGA